MQAGTCKHFNGLGFGPDSKSKTCDAGVCYRSLVGGPDFGWAIRIPCHRRNKTDIVCDKYQEPTAEEIAAFEKEIEAMIAKHDREFKLLDPLIRDFKKKHKGKSASEVLECPICKGKLHLSIAAVNGHVWGKCETENCVAWME